MRKPFPPCQNTFCCCCSVAQSCLTLCDPMDWLQHARLPCPSLSCRVCSNLVMLSNHLIFCLLLLLLPSVSACIRILSNEYALHIRWPKYWSLLSKGLSRIFSRTRIQKHQFSSDHGISQERIRSGLHFLLQGDLSNSGIKPTSPALAGRFFTTEPPGKRPQTHKLT